MSKRPRKKHIHFLTLLHSIVGPGKTLQENEPIVSYETDTRESMANTGLRVELRVSLIMQLHSLFNHIHFISLRFSCLTIISSSFYYPSPQSSLLFSSCFIFVLLAFILCIYFYYDILSIFKVNHKEI